MFGSNKWPNVNKRPENGSSKICMPLLEVLLTSFKCKKTPQVVEAREMSSNLTLILEESLICILSLLRMLLEHKTNMHTVRLTSKKLELPYLIKLSITI